MKTLRGKFWLIALLSIVGIAGIRTLGQAQPTFPAYWILGRYVIAALGKDPLVERFFNNPETFLVARRPEGAKPPLGWRSVPTVSYRSYASLAEAFRKGEAPRSGAILYDNEKWHFTPNNEKLHPARYYRMAGELAHAHGLMLVATPAMALSSVIDPKDKRSIAEKYIELGIARDAARYADAIDIQAQSLEYDPAQYADVVKRAAAQARAANPHVIVLAGLTTGRNRPDGSPVSLDDLLQAEQATQGIVDGYWLNVPQKGADCPQCTDFRPDLALQFLHRLASKEPRP